ncbi:MAG: outer membrane protein OmpU [Halocynthiibacter sp.]|jgi:outer membrane protein OmpU
MKKILLTASALSLLAGAAAAEVSVGGDARFGITFDTSTSTVSVQQRYRVKFNASTETDGGLTFGASVMLDTRNNNGVVNGFNAATPPSTNVSDLTGDSLNPVITVSGNGFDFALGNTNGAVVDVVGLWAGGLGFDGTVGRPALVGGFDTDGNQNQTVKVGYSFGDFAFKVSTASTGATDVEFAARYAANGIYVAVGGDSSNNYALHGSYTTGDIKVGAIYRNGNQYRVYGTYSMGATTIGAVYTKVAAGNAYGLGVSHSLGGGVSAHAAVGKQAAGGNTVVQVGMTMGF